MQSGSPGGAGAAVRVAAAARPHLAARVAVGRLGQLEVLLDVVDEAVDDVAVPEEGLVVVLLVITVLATVDILLLISLRRHDRASGH